MRIMRFGPAGHEVPVVIQDGTAYDLRPLGKDIDSAFLSEKLPRVRSMVAAGDLKRVDVTGRRIGAPVGRPGKIICVGLNYRDHAEETGAPIPEEPILFLKGGHCVVGPNDDVLIPRGSTKTDWEVELAVVIGAHASYLSDESSALKCVAGYTISNDVSERAYQLERGGQWDKGKNCATFNPLGPYLLTAADMDDPQQLRLRTQVNGEVAQDGTTSNMIFPVAHLIWYISQFMPLEPGDIINTGTPAGVAMGLPGQPYLREGDRMTVEIDGLGVQNQLVKGA